MFDRLKRGNEFAVGVYCPPQPPAGYLGNRIDDASYGLLAEAGVNVVLCMNEVFGGEWEQLGFRALDLAEKYGMVYLAQDGLLLEFVAFEGIDRPVKPFARLSGAEKKDLSARYLRSLARYMDHPACGGTVFFDEPGLKSLDGIGYARRIFKEKYPDKAFYINNFSYALGNVGLNYGILAGAALRPETEIEGLPPYTHENRFICYGRYMADMLDKVDPDILSFDLYPVQKLSGVKGAFHKGFFEMAALYSAAAAERGKPFWNYIQCGSWSEEEQYEVGGAEAALQINASLALGARGVVLFPGCYPNDWMHLGSSERRTDSCGLLDRYGEPTQNFFLFRSAIRRAKRAAEILLANDYLGAALYGSLPRILPGKNEGAGRDYDDCAYTGEDFLGTRAYRDGAIANVVSDGQILLAATAGAEGKAFFAVNMSNLTAIRLEIAFDRVYDVTAVCSDEKTRTARADSFVTMLAAGEGAVICLKN